MSIVSSLLANFVQPLLYNLRSLTVEVVELQLFEKFWPQRTGRVQASNVFSTTCWFWVHSTSIQEFDTPKKHPMCSVSHADSECIELHHRSLTDQKLVLRTIFELVVLHHRNLIGGKSSSIIQYHRQILDALDCATGTWHTKKQRADKFYDSRLLSQAQPQPSREHLEKGLDNVEHGKVAYHAPVKTYTVENANSQ